MTTQANIETQTGEPNAEQISEYLKNNPGFFDENPELVSGLQLSHSSGNAVSLIERQVQVLRDQNTELKSKLLNLVDVARDNDRLNERMHKLTRDMIQTGSLAELLDTLDDHMRNEFKADTVVVHLKNLGETRQRETNARLLVVDDELKTMFPDALTHNKPQCGRLKQEQLDFLFGDQAAAIESAAVVPLGSHAESGLLAIGSREINRFNPCMGTLFLSHLSEILSGVLGKHDIGQ